MAACCSWTPISALPCGDSSAGLSFGSCPSGLLDSLKDPDLQEKGQAAIKAFAPQLIWIVPRNRF